MDTPVILPHCYLAASGHVSRQAYELKNQGFEESYCDALNQLDRILMTYGHLKDGLSERLIKWALNWQMICPNMPEVYDDINCTEEEMAIIQNAIDAAMDEFGDAVETQFQQLKSFLHNDLAFGDQITTDPWYDAKDDRVWDKTDYEQCSRLLPFSQYTNQPYKAEAHPFAKAIEEWKDHFFDSVLCPVTQEEESLEMNVQNAAFNALDSGPLYPLMLILNAPNLPENVKNEMLKKIYGSW